VSRPWLKKETGRTGNVVCVTGTQRSVCVTGTQRSVCVTGTQLSVCVTGTQRSLFLALLTENKRIIFCPVFYFRTSVLEMSAERAS
jgi:hypothetical protein